MINHPHRKKKTVAAAASPTRPRVQRATPRVRPDHDRDYDLMLRRLGESFALAAGDGPLFTTDVNAAHPDLYACYLDSLPAEREVHKCSACRRFIHAYGGLVYVDVDGGLAPVMWSELAGDVPTFYKAAVLGMRDRVRRAKITGVFLTKDVTWGTPRSVAKDGSVMWRHMAVVPTAQLLHAGRALTPGQAMAAKLESFDTVHRALAEFPPALLDQALRVLESGHLDRAEKFLGPARWLRALHDLPLGRRGRNLFWKAIATAPEGYCHPRSSVLAPLLADIEAGTSFEVLRARHAAKVESTQYQRPQAAPTAGNIASAEALVAKLGIERSLERRFARLDELKTTWTPRAPAPSPRSSSGGVFSHLAPKATEPPGAPVALPPSTMTWAKFARDVLPRVERMQLLVPVRSGRFLAFTTAVHPHAPPILKWDRGGARNPVAWYVHVPPSTAATWNLSAGAMAEVEAVVPMPTMWGDSPMPFVSDGVVLILRGMKDGRGSHSNAIFPGCLHAELHGVRATIEAYSKSASLGSPEGSACGYDVRKDSHVDCALAVLSGGAWSSHRIDRWD